MQCPACNLTLVMAERTGVEIDYCPQCRGTEVSLAGAVRLASVRVWRCLVCEPDYAFDELLWRVRGGPSRNARTAPDRPASGTVVGARGGRV